MNNFLEKYDVTLETVGPLFIGSGREISKKEYAKLDDETIAVIDTSKIYKLAEKYNLKNNLEDYILCDSSNDLFTWVMSEEDTKINKAKIIKDSIKYKLTCKDWIEEREDRSALQILEFVRDPYWNPYIPGSSIKGMLRTALIISHITNNNDLYKNIDPKKAWVIEDIALNDKRGLTNDNLKGLRVSDSEPLNNDVLTLVPAVELHIDGKESTLPVLRESIMPNTKIKFSITIDTSICKITKENILDAILTFSNQWNINFGNEFLKSVDVLHDNHIILGGGGGFLSKTVVYSILGKIQALNYVSKMFMNNKALRDHKHDHDIELGLSPHILKCTYYNNKIYKMGQCSINFE